MAVRTANFFTLGFCLLAIAAILVVLPGAINRYGSEPEELWLLEIHLGYFSLLGALCFANLIAIGRSASSQRRRLACCSGLFMLLILALMIVGREDPLILLIGGLSLLGPSAMVFCFTGGDRYPQ